MKKILIVIFLLGCFTFSQARPFGYGGPAGDPLWIPFAAVVTVFGLVTLHNQNDYQDFERGIKETVHLIEDADTVKELGRVRATHSKYFTESVDSIYQEKKRSLENTNYLYENTDKEEKITVFLIRDAESIEDLENIKKNRLNYFTEIVQKEYFAKKKSLE
ncbi:hypothetical protein [Ilyobacter sp.]|uniref:hypothetical protein n=1 Tax=Ilyobacter sp. TaxID=3100343 RepID=UPI0035693470